MVRRLLSFRGLLEPRFRSEVTTAVRGVAGVTSPWGLTTRRALAMCVDLVAGVSLLLIWRIEEVGDVDATIFRRAGPTGCQPCLLDVRARTRLIEIE